MLVAVVSDSHDNVGGVRWAVEKISQMDVDALIHLGDVVAPFTLLEFQKIEVPVKHLILGNNDGEKLIMRKVAERLGFQLHDGPSEICIGGRKIFAFHGFGDADFTKSLAIKIAESGKYDAVMYGHTHFAFGEKIGGCIVLNPGELHGAISGIQSFLILDLDDMTTKSLHREAKFY